MTAELVMNDGTRQTFEKAYPASGFQYEIEAIQVMPGKRRKGVSIFYVNRHRDYRRLD